ADNGHHIQVTGRPARWTRLALVGEADPVAGIDAGRDLDGQGLRLPLAPVAVAAWARVFDHLPLAPAVGAGGDGAERAQERLLGRADLALATAGGAGLRLRALLAAAAFADGAGLQLRDLDAP